MLREPVADPEYAEFAAAATEKASPASCPAVAYVDGSAHEYDVPLPVQVTSLFPATLSTTLPIPLCGAAESVTATAGLTEAPRAYQVESATTEAVNLTSS